MNKESIPLWEKYCLSIPEASQLFGIGEKKIRQIVQEHSTDSTFVLFNGTKAMIKRSKFEEFINRTNTL